MHNKQLILQDGTIYLGYSFGADTDTIGEVVFNTAMTGYQETMSDPSYNGQIITFTYPLIGNYGINEDDFESLEFTVQGVICKEVCNTPSNFRSSISLSQALEKFNIPGISGIDTRSLTKKLRQYDVTKGAICNMDVSVEQVVERLQQIVLPNNQIEQMSNKQSTTQTERDKTVVLLDLGYKSNIVRELEARNCNVITLPFNTTAEQILSHNPDGLIVTNGPGNPEDAFITVQTIKDLIPKLPIFGICMGHQLIALAAGAKTYKLKFGHRGCNHPVKNLKTGRVDITSQNHGYAVNIESLNNSDLELTHIAVNDKSCEGLQHKIYPVFSVQYHPEAAPGPHDSMYLFDQFIENMNNYSDL